MANNYFQIKFGNFFSFFRSSVELQVHELYSETLQRQVKLSIFLPPARPWRFWERFPLVLFNDGQDMPSVRMQSQLRQLYRAGRIPPLIVVGIHAGDRMQEYGTLRTADYKNRGSKAKAYADFVIGQLLPWLHQNFRSRTEAADTSIAGFSLGGLSAFDLAWHYPQHFAKVGVFSGALWWRSEPFQENDPDADRIVHDEVAQSTKRPGLRFWFQTGTLDEESDRNNNGIIDAIDDTLDLIRLLKGVGYEDKAIRYVEIEGGHHHTDTWADILPDFFEWGYGK